MCLPRRRLPKQVAVHKGTRSTRSRSKSRVPEDSSLEISTIFTSSQLSKESEVSTGSSKSLAGLKDMLSDGAHIFSYKDLAKATDHFSPARKVGTSVFRGTVLGAEVAIVAVEKNRGEHQDFIEEIRKLCVVHHSNLVKLFGGCMSGDNVYLVYEFIPGANLRQCLHSTISPGFSALKAWAARVHIALDVAKGLEYLHDHTNPPFVHKYVKSSNILLDSELRARIANVGVAKIRGETPVEPGVETCMAYSEDFRSIPEGERSRRSRPSLGRSFGRSLGRSRSMRITGTHGYMAPEYISRGLITSKLDVFAFGVILLEILSGQEAVRLQRNVDDNSYKKTLLPEVIAAIFAEGDPKSRLRAWMDPLLRDSFPLDCAYKTAQLARRCVEPAPELRPPMSSVAMTLQQIFAKSQEWEEKMSASKGFITSSIKAR